METYTVYILYSPTTQAFYKGQTQDIQDRFKRHNARMENATKAGVPWLLLWTTQKNSRSEATILEAKLKNLSRVRLLQFMMKYSDGIAGPDELLLVQQLSGY